MGEDEKTLRQRERSATIAIWLASRGSRNRSPLDKLCRWLVNRAVRVSPQDDFMRDPLIDEDQGFDPDELDRYQRGEAEEPESR